MRVSGRMPVRYGPLEDAVRLALVREGTRVVVVAWRGAFMEAFDRVRRCIGYGGVVFVRTWIDAPDRAAPAGATFALAGTDPAIYVMADWAAVPAVRADVLVYVGAVATPQRTRWRACMAPGCTVVGGARDDAQLKQKD